MTQILLNQILADKSGKEPFALLHRPHVTGSDVMEVIVGEVCQPETLASIPLPENYVPSVSQSYDSALVLIPYRQLSERNFAYVDDDARLIALMITNHDTISVLDALKMIPHSPIELSNGSFDMSDADYADIVRKIKEDEIGHGAGSNFVIKRVFTADITQYPLQTAFTVFRHLMQNEVGAYWTFLIHTGDRTFVGASPEMQVNLKNGVVMMNPISGTYRYPSSGPTLDGVMNFLSASKEADELYMVVEEELKMIARFCPEGGRVVGPYLKEMSRLAHTEYFVLGKTTYDPREILRDTMFAPTVTGSPIENACRVIAKYEPFGRGYYGGVGALIGRDLEGNSSLDSTILIRTADINDSGRVRIGVGATIVRHSDPMAEAAETQAKAKALLNAMEYRR